MSIVMAAGRTDALPTSTRGPSVYATAGVRPYLLEVGVFNTSATAVAVALVRATAAGTQGTALTEITTSDSLQTPVATAFNTHTANATVGAAIAQATLAPSGGGVIWNWARGEFIIPEGTGNGVVIILPTGTGQNLDFWFRWAE